MENDLFPSTPLDEDMLPHADSKLKEELGSVIINEMEASICCIDNLGTNNNLIIRRRSFTGLIFLGLILAGWILGGCLVATLPRMPSCSP